MQVDSCLRSGILSSSIIFPVHQHCLHLAGASTLVTNTGFYCRDYSAPFLRLNAIEQNITPHPG